MPLPILATGLKILTGVAAAKEAYDIVSGSNRDLNGGQMYIPAQQASIPTPSGGSRVRGTVVFDEAGNAVGFRPSRRKRRRRMLTCSDKVDLAFIKATFGNSDAGKQLISTAMCRR